MSKEDKVTMDELAYYCFNCNGLRFAQDIFREDITLEEFNSHQYILGKFSQFQNKFQEFLYNLDGGNRKKLATAIKKFYKEKK